LLQNNYCYNISGVGNSFDYPTQTIWANADCTGAPKTATLSPDCTPVTTYPVGENNHLVSSTPTSLSIFTQFLENAFNSADDDYPILL